MNYELAKELADNGFPHEICEWTDEHPDRTTNQHVPVPTLSDLIEACGDGFAFLSKIEAIPGGTSWTAGGWDDGHGCTDKECCEDAINEQTPEEAVARLWFALNKKPRD